MCFKIYQFCDSETAIMWAAHRGNAGAIRRLVAAGADVNWRDNNANTPLIRAAEKNHVDCVVALVELGCDLNLVNSVGSGWTALDIAIDNGHDAIYDYLTMRGAERAFTLTPDRRGSWT